MGIFYVVCKINRQRINYANIVQMSPYQRMFVIKVWQYMETIAILAHVQAITINALFIRSMAMWNYNAMQKPDT